MFRYFLFAGFTLLYSGLLSAQDYKNPKLPVEKRVADLLGRMTLEEKVAQLRSFHMSRPKLTDDVLNNSSKMDSMFSKG